MERPLHGGQGHLHDRDVHEEHERRPAHGDEGPPVALGAAVPALTGAARRSLRSHLTSSPCGLARPWRLVTARTESLLRAATGVQDRGESPPRALAASLGPAASPARALGSLCTVRSVWTSRRAVSLHVALIVFVPACAALTWWQVSQGPGGQHLELGLHLRVADLRRLRRVHVVEARPRRARARRAASTKRPGPTRPTGRGQHPGDSADAGDALGAGHTGEQDEQDEELAAYNRYLADLNASGRQKRW